MVKNLTDAVFTLSPVAMEFRAFLVLDPVYPAVRISFEGHLGVGDVDDGSIANSIAPAKQSVAAPQEATITLPHRGLSPPAICRLSPAHCLSLTNAPY